MIFRDRDSLAVGPVSNRPSVADGTLDERVYELQNWRSDLVALITDTGDQREQVQYEPYGTPFGLPAGDLDSDGDFDATDYAGITGAYDVRKDVNMDGSITFADTTAAYNINGLQTLGRGVASSDAVTNRKGYAGYEHLAELAGAKWDVRNRVLLSELGTWNRRDPLGYVDGMNLYAYAMLIPQVYADPTGLTVDKSTQCKLPLFERFTKGRTSSFQCRLDLMLRLASCCSGRYPPLGWAPDSPRAFSDCLKSALDSYHKCSEPAPPPPPPPPPPSPRPGQKIPPCFTDTCSKEPTYEECFACCTFSCPGDGNAALVCQAACSVSWKHPLAPIGPGPAPKPIGGITLN